MTRLPPLSPDAGGMSLSPDALAPADLIVSTTPATVSRVIRGFTGSAVSHAMLYAGKGQVIEAVADGVVRRPLTQALAEAKLAVGYRAAKLGPGQAQRVVAEAASLIGRAYDAGGAATGGVRSHPFRCVMVMGTATRVLNPIVGGVGAGTGACAAVGSGVLGSAEKFYCSELVLEAFDRAGAKIADVSPGSSTPQHIPDAYSKGTLAYLGHLVTK